jgi:hypothetical protein
MIEVNEGVRWPKFALQLLAGNHLPRVLQKGSQNLQWLLL